MKIITEQLNNIKKRKSIGLMTHVVAGFPSMEDTVKIVQAMERAGVDFIEIQIPFSDPLADGPTIMRANDRALQNGVTLQDCFGLAKRLSQTTQVPLFYMCYYNTVFHFGVEKFCVKSKEVGVQGLIVPDMPVDEEDHEHLIQYCDKYGLAHIKVLSPTSTTERINLNAEQASGFVYCTARSGTTGAQHTLDTDMLKYLARVKKYVKVPLAVGFGISKPEHVRALVGRAEVAVVGSAVIDLIEKEGVGAVENYLKNLRSLL